ANTGVPHLIGPTLANRWNDLQHGAVRRTHEVVAVVFEIDDEFEILGVPEGELFRIRRSNRRMFESIKHEEIVAVEPALDFGNSVAYPRGATKLSRMRSAPLARGQTGGLSY